MINFIRTSKKGYILGLLLITIAGISVGCTANAETTKSVEPPTQNRDAAATTQTPDMRINHNNPYSDRYQDGDMEYYTPAPKESSANLTKAVFNKIKPGMTLGEVEIMMGEQGLLVSTMEVNGRKTQIYKWSNDDFSSYIDVTIEKGKVIEKKDKGLK